MIPTDRARFDPVTATLKDGRQITVRTLTADDGDALTEFYESVPREDYRFYCPHPLDRERAHQKAAERADSPNFVCTVGVGDAGQIVGYAWYEWAGDASESSHFGICIRRGYQNGGTGQAIVGRLWDIAREIGPPRMRLTVQKANARAIALYQKMGFTIVREQERGAVEEFPPEPEYAMERATR